MKRATMSEKKTGRPSESLSPPIILDTPSEFTFNEEYQQLLTAYAKQYCMPFIPISEIKNSSDVDNSEEIKQLLQSQIGLQAIVTSLEHDFTLVIPVGFTSLTIEFLMTHMIKKYSSDDNHFVTFNGLYGRIDENSIYLFENQRLMYPWRCMTDLFIGFPQHFYDNLPDQEMLNEDGVKNGRAIKIRKHDSLQTPLGILEIIFIQSPLMFENSCWKYLDDNLLTGYVWKEYEGIELINKTDDSDEIVFSKRIQHKDQHSGEEFLNNISKPEAQLVRDAFEKSFKQYISIKDTLTFDDKSLFLNQMIAGVKAKIGKSDVYGKTFKEKSKNIDDCLKIIFCISLFDCLWIPLFDNSVKQKKPIPSRDKDRKLESTILIKQFIQPEHLGLDFLNTKGGEEAIKEIGMLFRDINSKRSPIEKMKIIKDLFMLTEHCIKQLNNEVNDDLVKRTLAYVLVKMNIPYVPSNILYIQTFYDLKVYDQTMISILNRLEEVISFINTSLVCDKLKISSTDFFAMNEKAKKKSQKPLNFNDYYSTEPCHWNKKEIESKFDTISPEELTEQDLDILLKSYKKLVKENRELELEISKLEKESK